MDVDKSASNTGKLGKLGTNLSTDRQVTAAAMMLHWIIVNNTCPLEVC